MNKSTGWCPFVAGEFSTAAEMIQAVKETRRAEALEPVILPARRHMGRILPVLTEEGEAYLNQRQRTRKRAA